MLLIDSLRWFDPVRLPKYPHLSFVDARLWESFLKTKPDELLKVAYDIIVGQGRFASPDASKNEQKNWKYLTSFKIDVLAKTKMGYWIFECKHEANPESLGQILVYSYYLQNQYKIPGSIRKTILCDIVHPDMYSPCHNYNVDILDIGMLQEFPKPPISCAMKY